VAQNVGSKFWLSVFYELKNRGVQDSFIVCVDGLKVLPEAVETVFSHTQVQLCIVYELRNSLKYVPWKERKAEARDLRAIYAAPTLPEAEQALEQFCTTWDAKYPAIGPRWLWRADWQWLTYSPEVRKVIYTINAIESLSYSLRKLLKMRGAFPTDDSIVKVLYLAIIRVAKKWTMPIRDWRSALNQFVILFGDRVPV
jgi:putative transposase